MQPDHMSTTHSGGFTLSLLIAERQAGKLCIPMFMVVGLTRPGIESVSSVAVADALSTRPLIGFTYMNFSRLIINDSLQVRY